MFDYFWDAHVMFGSDAPLKISSAGATSEMFGASEQAGLTAASQEKFLAKLLPLVSITIFTMRSWLLSILYGASDQFFCFVETISKSALTFLSILANI